MYLYKNFIVSQMSKQQIIKYNTIMYKRVLISYRDFLKLTFETERIVGSFVGKVVNIY